MNKTMVALMAVLTLVACSKKKEGGNATGSGSGGSAAAGAGSGGAGGGGTAGAGGAANAAGEEPAASETVTTCPKSLSGTDKVNRVITKECGPVPVTDDYAVDGATLTLEAGATLVFAPDARSLGIGYYATAKLIVKGTKDAPVTMTTSGDKAAGAWSGLAIYAKGSRSSIEGLVIEYAGADDAKGAVWIDAQDVVFKNSTVKNSKDSALKTSNDATFTEFSGNTFVDIGVPAAIVVNPTAAGMLAPGNTFPANAFIHVMAGTIKKSSKWNNAGAPYAVLERVAIDGAAGARATLELAPGIEIRMDADSGFTVGYYAEAAIKAVGTKDAPIKLTAFETKEPGGWESVEIYGNGEGTFEYVTFEYGGANEDKGALHISGNVKVLSVKNCTFKANKRGVDVASDKVQVRAFDGNVFDATPNAIRAPAEVVGAIGGGNTYGEGSKIEILGGTVDKDTTWKAQTAELEVLELVAVNKARLTVEAGTRIAFKDTTGFDIGYYDSAGLQLRGTADKPIKLRGLRDEPEGWRGIHLYGNARGNVVEHVVIHNAGDKAAVIADAKVDLKVDDLTCVKCKEAALTYACEAQVTASGIKNEGGTPKGEIKPSCK
jgi:hypothetical protein